MRHVLLDTWDPIGIRDAPNAQDEYDGYIGKLYDLLAGGAADSELVDYPFWAAHEHMGLDSSRREDMHPTVAELRKIDFSAEGNSRDSHL